ncbi:MAG: YIP1 family protein [Candidatus Saganbacteria bacterium]|nr:YIP1 family protein [Candidatus Saganbacteria bacterium]
MIIDRVKKLILSPAEAWKEIAAEESSIKSLFLKYAIFLALIPALSMIVGFGVVGLRIGPAYYHMPINTALYSALVSFVVYLLGVFSAGFIFDFIGQYFSAESNLKQAMKLSVYSSTPFFLAGIFSIIPSMSFLSIIGLYSVYLLYLGIPALLKVPEDKIMPFTVTVIMAAIILGFLLSGVVNRFAYGPIYLDRLTY